MKYWLLKSEPDAYSWDDLVRQKTGRWDGVRNYQARAHLMHMKKGDLGLFYHSNIGREIVGIMEIVKEAYPDPTDATDKFVCVDVKPHSKLKKPVTLVQIKADARLQQMALIRQSRLSVMPVTLDEWKVVAKLAAS